MQFDSLGEFLGMGGHGPYIWMAYGAFFVVLAGLLASARSRGNDVRRRIRRQLDTSADLQSSEENVT